MVQRAETCSSSIRRALLVFVYMLTVDVHCWWSNTATVFRSICCVR